MDKYLLIKQECLRSKTKDPVELILSIMNKDYIHIHGPEHHVLDGACFLTALHRAGLDFDLENALDEMIERGKMMPGATCGKWGMCGSSASIGAALSIIHETGPLSSNQFYKDNLLYVSSALNKIGEVGGPRCCKRNAFLSIRTGIDFVKENYNIDLPKSAIICTFSNENKQCIKVKCPFHKENSNE